MNYYVLPIIINDRREVNLQLSNETISSNTTNKYIVEVPENMQFSLISMLRDAEIRSFVPETTELDLADLHTSYILSNNKLTVSLQAKQKTQQIIAEPEPEQPKDLPLSYDDLDSYQPQKKAKPIIPDIPEVSSSSIAIGNYENIMAISANNYSTGALNIFATVGNNLNQISGQFPDLTIEINLLTNDRLYQNSITISFAHPEQFLGIALDFGSESSQLAVKRYQIGFGIQERPPEHENLYHNIRSFHKAKGWIARDDNSKYYQEEENTNYYKSIFFLKEDLTGDYEDIERELFIQEMPENLKMLVNSSSHDNGYASLTEKHFHQLPNLKITHKYVDVFTGLNFNINKEGYDINVSLSEVKNKTYNSILHVIIESFLKKEFIKFNGAKRKVRFVLLVPNIYDHIDVRHTQLLLNKIFQDFADHEYNGKLLAWEILTISESDASFLGYINKNDVHIKNDSDYIIVDAGKGTTDFSVIRTGKENLYNIKPIYRNGFAGAGNMVTFSIFETVLHFIRAHAEHQNNAYRFIKEEILANLTDSNLEIKNQFYKQLERLKFNYNRNSGYVLNQWNNAKSGDFSFKNLTDGGANITTLIDLLSQIENVADFYGYIFETANLIAQRVVSNLKMIKENKDDFNCAGILLTGRGFLFPVLEEELRRGISEQLKISDSLVHRLEGNELKDVCIKGVFNNTVRVNTERIGYPIQIVVREKPVENNQQQDKIEPVSKKPSIGNRLLGIFFNELNDIENAEAIIANEKPVAFDSLYKSQILIGSKRFKVGSSSLFDNQNKAVDADIIFTPQGYVVRKKENGVIKNILMLNEIFDTDKVEMNMVIPSLFPNYMDDKYIFSLRRDDIKRAPILPPPPPPMGNTDAPKPKGPLYF